MSQPRERWLRRLMGLGPAPDPVGLLVVNGATARWHASAWSSAGTIVKLGTRGA
jgi:hypothetical protein